MYIHRTIEPILQKAAQDFPVLVITGPRQSGKTTVLKHLFGATTNYVSLDAPDIRERATADPRTFLAVNPAPLIIDEIQHVPELFSYIKEIVDQNRDKPYQYILTGSQNLLLSQHVNESLAGRAAILKLLPLSLTEILGNPQGVLPWQDNYAPFATDQSLKNLWNTVLKGGYPEMVKNPERDPQLWQSSYIQTYLERDIRYLRQVGDLREFQTFLRALAARSGQLLNISELSRDIGVAVNTVKAWLSVLEATYQIIIIRPYYANIGKRLMKTPKVYFLDVGTLCYLVGLKDVDHALQGPMGGAIFETFVVSEIFKIYTHQGSEPRLYCWRTTAGLEVDLVIEDGMHLVPIEIKLSGTPNLKMLDGLKVFLEDFKEKATRGYVINPSLQPTLLTSFIQVIPFGQI